MKARVSQKGCFWLSSVAAATFAVLTLMALHIISGVREATRLNIPVLKGVRKEWLLDNCPSKPRIDKYVAGSTSPDRFFVITNTYTIDGRAFEPLLGMDDKRFEGRGTLAISRDGAVIWIPTKKKPVLLEAPKNSAGSKSK